MQFSKNVFNSDDGKQIKGTMFWKLCELTFGIANLLSPLFRMAISQNSLLDPAKHMDLKNTKLYSKNSKPGIKLANPSLN
jgi:hypothetical protein